MNALSTLSHRWRPIHVYQSKVDHDAEECLSEDQPFPDEQEDNVDQQRGNFLEPAVRAWYAHRESAYVEDPGTRFHPQHKRILATADGLVRFSDGRAPRGLEIKCPRFAKMNDWCPGQWPHDIRLPIYYYPQVTCEAAVLGVSSVDVAVLLGDELRIINVPFDEEFFEKLVVMNDKFWTKHIEPRIPPPPDASVAYGDYLRDKWPKFKNADFMVSDDLMLREARAYFDASVKIRELEKVQRASRNYLCSRLGEARGVQFEQGAKVLWTNDSDKEEVDYEALVKHLDVSRETIEKFTKTKPGARKFRPFFNGWKK